MTNLAAGYKGADGIGTGVVMLMEALLYEGVKVHPVLAEEYLIEVPNLCMIWDITYHDHRERDIITHITRGTLKSSQTLYNEMIRRQPGLNSQTEWANLFIRDKMFVFVVQLSCCLEF